MIPNKTDVIILCGGLGTRLRPVLADCPKILAPFGKQIFLDYLLNNMAKQGFRNFIFSVGFMKDKVIDHCRANYKNSDIKITFAEEDEPLGTGGGVKNAMKFISSDPFLIANGDSFWNIDFADFCNFHTNNQSLASIALAKRTKAGSSLITLADSNEISMYAEKNPDPTEGYKSAGVYIMNQKVSEYFPAKSKFSLEYDVFPALVDKRLYGYILNGEFLDFGTPEKYREALNVKMA